MDTRDSLEPSEGSLERLSREEIAQLKQILKWWTEKSDDNNPKFKHDQPRICPVRLSTTMYEDAIQLARNKSNYRTFSRMVEMLIWKELGSDPKYIKIPPVTDDQE
jgi:hypothetical protein